MELLKKWLDGSINWKEEKLLREEARKDSFLADALGGLDTISDADHVHNIEVLEQRLQERVSKKNKRAIYPFKAIAAAAILLLSVGIWWNMQGNFKQPTITEMQTKSVSPTSPLMEMNTTADNEGASIPNTVASITESIVEEKKELPKEFNTKSNMEATMAPTKELAVVQKELPSTILSNDLKEETLANSQETVEIFTEASSIVMEEAPSKVSAIVVENEEEEDAAGIAYVEEAVVASPTPVVKAAESMLLTPAPTDMGVISAIAESDDIPASKVMKRRSTNLPTTKVFPIGGMEDFLMYLKDNKRNPEIANVKGTVFLVFSLDKDGTVKDIEITKSLHPDYDKEAIRLLKEGPKWISPASVGYCKISFGLE